MSTYKWCFVPKCTNTSLKNTDKEFFTVPKAEKQRKKWFKAARRDMNVSLKSTLYCCEDHFKMEEDMENFMRYKMIGGLKRLKSDALPHIFCCQEDRERTFTSPSRKVPLKRTQQRLIEDALRVQQSIPPHTTCDSVEEQEQDIEQDLMDTQEPVTPMKTFAVASVQTYVCHRSKGIHCNLGKKKVLSTATSPIKQQRDAMTSPMKNGSRTLMKREMKSISSSDSDEIFEAEDCGNGNDSEYQPCSSESDDSDSEVNNSNFIQYSINKKPKMYTGVPDEWYVHVLPLLRRYSDLSLRDIKLTLMKIKTNDSFERLGDQFSMSCGHACKIFNCTVPVLAHILKELIYWPDRMAIKRQLPIPFRYNYFNVQSIIDCLEIEIEKPSDPVKQALTWSEYKSCNTLKYLVSSTPDGFINYVSEGYGGRISDSLLVEECGFLEKLPTGGVVMADRGFKSISQLLASQGCQLVKPPSVSAGTKSSKQDVLETKRIASLRIHIERVIRRLREFEFLKPHAIIPSKLIASTNDVIVVACGLVNIQSPIIKV